MEFMDLIDFGTPIRKLTIDPKTLRKLWIWSAASDIEISAIGEIAIQDDTIHVTDTVHLLKQEGSSGSTELDMDAYDVLIRRYIKEGKSLEPLRFWFHTHPKMGIWFSMTDEDTIDDLGANGETYVAAVFNERGESQWCVTRHGIRMFMKINVPGPKPTYDEKKQAQVLLKEFVTERSYWRFKSWRKGKNHAYEY